jgi:hypothetical protein
MKLRPQQKNEYINKGPLRESKIGERIGAELST